MFKYYSPAIRRILHSFPTRRSSDLSALADLDMNSPSPRGRAREAGLGISVQVDARNAVHLPANSTERSRSEEHTSELQSPVHLVCRLLLEKKKLKHKD